MLLSMLCPCSGIANRCARLKSVMLFNRVPGSSRCVASYLFYVCTIQPRPKYSVLWFQIPPVHKTVVRVAFPLSNKAPKQGCWGLCLQCGHVVHKQTKQPAGRSGRAARDCCMDRPYTYNHPRWSCTALTALTTSRLRCRECTLYFMFLAHLRMCG